MNRLVTTATVALAAVAGSVVGLFAGMAVEGLAPRRPLWEPVPLPSRAN